MWGVHEHAGISVDSDLSDFKDLHLQGLHISQGNNIGKNQGVQMQISWVYRFLELLTLKVYLVLKRKANVSIVKAIEVQKVPVLQDWRGFIKDDEGNVSFRKWHLNWIDSPPLEDAKEQRLWSFKMVELRFDWFQENI